MVIQYFPGHMAKTLREIKELASHIDVIYELRDARIPFSSKNPLLAEWVSNKPIIQIWTKKDLADPVQLQRDLATFDEPVIVLDLLHDSVTKTLQQATRAVVDKPVVQALVVGIPNVGKSTLINRLSGKAKTKVENRPGVTRHLQWIPISKTWRLLDTPGLLWQKFDDQDQALRLAALGMIPMTHVVVDELALFILKYMSKHYPKQLAQTYLTEATDPLEILDHIGQHRGMKQGGGIDYDRVYHALIHDLQKGRIGKVSFDGPL